MSSRKYNGNPSTATTSASLKGHTEETAKPSQEPRQTTKTAAFSFGDGSEIKQAIRRERVLSPDATLRKIAERVGCCYSTVSRVDNDCYTRESQYSYRSINDMSETATC